MKQSTNHILMVRPAHFGYNAETAFSNAFQHKSLLSQTEIQELAMAEFDMFVAKLREQKIDVTVIDDTDFPIKPDAVFPNNWISFHANGTIVLYPMHTPNRQVERRVDVVEKMTKKFDFTRVLDISSNECFDSKNSLIPRFLEGTGSIVFDHEARMAFACISPRTNEALLLELCETINYRPFVFCAVDENGKKIYHTNVMMNIAKGFAVVCLESIPDLKEREKLIAFLKNNHHEIIDISFEQMKHFAGNMLAVESVDGKLFLICSQTAFDVLTEPQKNTISKFAVFLSVAIPTIETVGGGSVRCMMAEVFIPLKNSDWKNFFQKSL